MLLPIRCFTCNKILGHFGDYLEKNKVDSNFFEKNNIKRYCCKKIFLTSIYINKDLYGKRNSNFYTMKKYSEVHKILLSR